METGVLRPSDKDNQLPAHNSLKDSWDAIRFLDEEENWAERNRVLSKKDHEHLLTCAKEILNELVQELPIDQCPPVESYQPVEELTDDDFNYSAAQFDVDYLERISSEGDPQQSALARESLYVKFDPLVGKGSPKKGTKTKSPKTPQAHNPGDLLQFNTPPTNSRNDVIHNRAVHEPSTPSSLLSSSHQSEDNSLNNTLTPQSHHKTPVSAAKSRLDSSDVAEEETDAGVHSPNSDCLIKVLKYSEEDLTQLLEEARERGRERNKENVKSEVSEFRKKITTLRQQMKPQQSKNSKIKQKSDTYETKKDKIQRDIEEFCGTLESHCSTQLERLDEHTEIRNHKQQSKKYYELVGKGASLLETKFDELHSQHVQLKAVHKKVSQAVNGMEEYCETLEAQNGEIAETCTHLQSELQARMGEVTQKLESLRKDHTSKISIERTKTMKFQLEAESLETSLQQLEQDKQQLSQLCEELMAQLEAKNA